MLPLDPKPRNSKTQPVVVLPSAPLAPAVPDAAPAAAPAVLSAPPGVADFANAVRRRWLTILLLGPLAAALGAAAGWYFTPAPYSVQVNLHLDPHPPRGFPEAGEDFANYQRTVMAEVKSYATIRATLDKPGVSDLAEVRAKADAADWLMREGVVDGLLGPEVLRITLTGDRAQDVAAVLNAWAQTCSEQATAKEEAKIKARVKQLKESYRDTAEMLRKKKVDLRAREELLGLEDPVTVAARLQSALALQSTLQGQRFQLELDLKKSEVDLVDQRAAVLAPDKLVIAPSAIEQEVLNELKLDQGLKAQFDRMMQVKTNILIIQSRIPAEDQPAQLAGPRKELAALEAGIADQKKILLPLAEERLRAKALDDLKDSTLKLDRHVATVQEQERTLDAKIKDLERQIVALRTGGPAAGKANPDVDALRAEVEQTTSGLQKIGEEEGLLEASLPLAPRVTVMEAAAPPTTRKNDRQLKTAGALGLGLFGLVFVGVALVEFRARRVYKADDVSQGLGLPLVGTVPALRSGGRRGAAAASQVALVESVDAIRTMLLHASRIDPLRVVVVASAMGGEGKTSLASQLAASLARGGRRTLLVDCDLRNPAAHQLFSLKPGPGFSELLRAEYEPSDVIQATPIENLSLLAAGACDRRALQALSYEGGLQAIFDDLKEQFDYIIVDVCPVLLVTDALLIAQHADGVLLSVMRNVSRLPLVYAALQRLASLGIRTLGAVVIGEDGGTYGQITYPKA